MKQNIDLKNARYQKSEIKRCTNISECSIILPELRDFSGYTGPDLIRYLDLLLKSRDSYVWVVKRGDKVIGSQLMIITGDVARIACLKINHYDLQRLLDEALIVAQMERVKDVQLYAYPSRKIEKLGFKLHKMVYKIEVPEEDVVDDAEEKEE